MAKAPTRDTPATQAYTQGLAMLQAMHLIFSELSRSLGFVRSAHSCCPAHGWAQASLNHQRFTGQIDIHPKRMAKPEEWAYCLGRATLSYALELFQRDRSHWAQWSAACDVVTARFIQTIKLGRPPEGMELPDGLPYATRPSGMCSSANKAYLPWAQGSKPGRPRPGRRPPQPGPAGAMAGARILHQQAAALLAQVRQLARNVCCGPARPSPWKWRQACAASLARAALPAARWTSHATGSWTAFRCWAAWSRRLTSSRTPASASARTSPSPPSTRYCAPSTSTPALHLSELELRFVIAHEVLHVALRHLPRRRGREPFLWNGLRLRHQRLADSDGCGPAA